MRPFLLASGLCLALSSPAAAQITLNLANTGNISEPVEPGTVQIVIENRVPHIRYDYVIRRETIPIQAFSVQSIGSFSTSMEARSKLGANAGCDTLAAATSALAEVTSESQVPAARAIVNELISEGRCTDDTFLISAKTLVGATTHTLSSLSIIRGERVTVTVTRPAPEGQTVTWTLLLSTPPRGEWFLTYGFSLTNSGDDFTTEPVDGGRFRVIEKSNRWGLAPPTPAVFFSWLPRSQKNRDLSFSPSVGLGLEQGVPALFAGLAITYNQNISVMLGGGAASQKRLYERYRNNPLILEELKDDQLHERQYSLAPIIAISLRFDKNPFKKTDPPAVGAATTESVLRAPVREAVGVWRHHQVVTLHR